MVHLTFVVIFLLHRDYDNLQIIFKSKKKKNDSPITPADGRG